MSSNQMIIFVKLLKLWVIESNTFTDMTIHDLMSVQNFFTLVVDIN